MTKAVKTVWADGAFHTDGWQYLADTENSVGDIVISLSDWQDKRRPWDAHEGRLGLNVHAGDDMDAIAKALPHFDLVVVNFPAFADGRAFSIARLIRDRFGFEGEIRAKGNFIIDQMPLLARCGVDTFDVSLEAARAGLERGLWPDMPRYYQHALDSRATTRDNAIVDARRPWLSNSRHDSATPLSQVA